MQIRNSFFAGFVTGVLLGTLACAVGFGIGYLQGEGSTTRPPAEVRQ